MLSASTTGSPRWAAASAMAAAGVPRGPPIVQATTRSSGNSALSASQEAERRTPGEHPDHRGASTGGDERLGERRPDGARGIRIVSAVDDHHRVGTHHLDAPGHPQRLECGLDHLGIDLTVQDRLRCLDRHRDVGRLMRTVRRNEHLEPRAPRRR